MATSAPDPPCSNSTEGREPPPAAAVADSAGGSVDVSPNGSWLAWFKQLRAPSPVSLTRRGLDAQNTNPTCHACGAPAPLLENQAPLSSQTTIGREPPLCASCHARNFQRPLGASSSSLQMEAEKKNQLIGSSREIVASASFRPCCGGSGFPGGSGCAHCVTGSGVASGFGAPPSEASQVTAMPGGSSSYPLKAAKGVGSQRVESALIESLSTLSVSDYPCCGSHRIHHFFSSKRRTLVFILILVILLVALVLCLLFFLIIPRLIQAAIDNSDLQLLNAEITNPSTQGFTLDLQSQIKRSSAVKVQMLPFSAQVSFAPDPQHKKDTHVRILLETQPDETLDELPPPPIVDKSDFKCNSTLLLRHPDDNLAKPICQEQINNSKIFDTNRFFHLATPHSPLTRHLLSSSSLEVENTGDSSLITLGSFSMPEMTMKGKTVQFNHTTDFNISDFGNFELFEQQLLRRGREFWVMSGSPSIIFLGIKYGEFKFKKNIPIKIAKMIISQDEFLHSLPDELKSKVQKQLPTLPHVQSPVQFTTPENDDTNTLANKMKVYDLNLTRSTDSQVLMQAKIDLISDSLISLKPLGALTLFVKYSNYNLIKLSSDRSTNLIPGLNTLVMDGVFYGTDSSVDQETAAAGLDDEDHDSGSNDSDTSDGGSGVPDKKDVMSRGEALNSFVSALLKGEKVPIEIKGATSSQPLYDPAIKSIRLFQMFQFADSKKLSQTNSETTSSDGIISNNENQQEPLLRSMQFLEMQLLQDPSNKYKILLIGKVQVILGNPLGSTSTLKVPNVDLDGFLTFEKDLIQNSKKITSINDKTLPGNSSNDLVESPKKTLGRFSGNLKSSDAAAPVYSRDSKIQTLKLGKMPVVLESLEFHANLTLDASSDEGTAFGLFSKDFVEKEYVKLSLEKVNSTVSTNTALGPLVLSDIPISQSLTLKGFGGLKNVKLSNFKIHGGQNALDMIVQNSFQFPISADIIFTSNSMTSLQLGNVTFELSYNGHHLAYMHSSNAKIKPGQNLLTFEGSLGIGTVDFTGIIQFLRDYRQQNKNVQVDVKFVDNDVPTNNARSTPTPDLNGTVYTETTQPTEDGEAPWFIKKALTGIVLHVTLPRSPFMRSGNDGSTDATYNNSRSPLLARARHFGAEIVDGFLADPSDAASSDATSHQNGSFSPQQVPQDGSISGASASGNSGSLGHSAGGLLRNFLNGVLSARQREDLTDEDASTDDGASSS